MAEVSERFIKCAQVEIRIVSLLRFLFGIWV